MSTSGLVETVAAMDTGVVVAWAENGGFPLFLVNASCAHDGRGDRRTVPSSDAADWLV